MRSRSTYSIVSRATCFHVSLPKSIPACMYTRASSAWSYNIFSKWGTSHISSTLYRENPPPIWSYMPPLAMASSDVVTTFSRSLSSPASSWRNSTSRFIVLGNFGAFPKPPHDESKLARSWVTASSNVENSAMLECCSIFAVRSSASINASMLLLISSRRLFHASVMAFISCRNDGFGK